MNLKLNLNMESLTALLPKLQKAQPLIFGALLVAVFGYTSFVINQALNVQPAAAQTAIDPLPKVSFDKKTIAALKKLNAVGGEVPLGDLGTSDPFK
jgi:hypothetical protein